MALDELQNGRYRSLRLLGSGGMGEVYLMNDTRVSRQVAIKVIRSEGAPYPGSDSAKDAARLFQREAKAIAALDHPHILPLYDFGEEALEDITISYMVMPLCIEGSLTGWLRQSGSAVLTPPDIAQLVEQAADALQYAHDHQVIHLDVKPSNFLLRSNRKNQNCPTLLLADFGIARSSTTAISSSRTIRGTPTSMAPEQWSS
ncbi:MAG TPA: serine/threonine-protein kinase, partial [Ktedonobacteraceae bacterium]|nr:serine/threonine-protein kinase [Ktedonobacteraceae bacterium]